MVPKKTGNSPMFKNPIEKENYMISQIIDNFDFERCARAMSALSWTWGFDNTPPTIERLKESATKRLKDAINICKGAPCHKASYFSSSGGLKGNAWKNKYGQIEAIKLEFVLTDWESDGDY